MSESYILLGRALDEVLLREVREAVGSPDYSGEDIVWADGV